MKHENSVRPGSLTRRHVLLVLPSAVVVALGTACKDGPPASCENASSLPKDDLAARAALKYVELSGDPKTRCSACRQYVPAPSKSACGTCKIMKGPIHPNGTCQAFAAL